MTGTTARRTDGVGKVVEGVGARFTEGSRIRASETVRIKALSHGMFEVTFCTKGNAKSVKQVHWGTASGPCRGVVLDEVATTRMADLMGHIIRGMKGDEAGSGIQADYAMGWTEMNLKPLRKGGHDSATQGLRGGVYVLKLTFFTC